MLHEIEKTDQEAIQNPYQQLQQDHAQHRDSSMEDWQRMNNNYYQVELNDLQAPTKNNVQMLKLPEHLQQHAKINNSFDIFIKSKNRQVEKQHSNSVFDLNTNLTQNEINDKNKLPINLSPARVKILAGKKVGSNSKKVSKLAVN